MDEAEQLGDRIGVMQNGRLITCGSAGFLKSLFGVGYVIVVSVEQGNSVEKVLNGI